MGFKTTLSLVFIFLWNCSCNVVIKTHLHILWFFCVFKSNFWKQNINKKWAIFIIILHPPDPIAYFFFLFRFCLLFRKNEWRLLVSEMYQIININFVCSSKYLCILLCFDIFVLCFTSEKLISVDQYFAFISSFTKV